uniref:triacylglycerol lipase n=1 Tax=Megacormus gertschi TaxID=1843536 RepID=A0A224X3Q6_9SCOR
MMNLSLSGCGFLCIYHVGVASCFREYAPHVLVDKIAGASGGSLAACALICSVPLGETTSDVLRIALQARSRTLGPLHPGFDLNKILYDGLVRMLPEDAHLRCNGRLHVSVTRVKDFKNVLLSEFNSRDDLIQALLCSCFIPFYSGIVPPKFCGVAYVDGGFSDNLPVLDDNTITVSPFAGESDICPQDTSFNVLQFSMSNTSISISAGNLYRFVSTLFPPHPEVLSQMCQQGFDDALKFLQRNNIISCTRCLAVQSSFGIAESGTKADTVTKEILNDHPDDDCIDCRYRRQMALLDSLPEAVVKAIEDCCEQMNKGVINWLFRHNPVKILPFFTLPYVLPIDITIVVFAKIWETLPYIQREMKSSLSEIFSFARNLISSFDKKNQYSAKFSCQLAITEFDYANKERKTSPTSPIISVHHSPPVSESTTTRHQMKKRMSYAGCANISREPPVRRKSMVETSSPERVIKNMKFDFTVDLSEASMASESRKKKKVIDAFQSLKENNDTNVFDIASKVLELEKDYIEYIEPQKADFVEALEVTNTNEAVMAFFYKEGKKVKVTEIFNISDENASIAMTDDEKELNTNLQWDSGWDMVSSALSDYESAIDVEEDKDLFPSDNEYMSPSTSYGTPDMYSLDVHGTELRRARKKSVVSKLPFLNLEK